MNRPRVLLIEDDPLILEMVALRLEREGYAVATATDGGQGLARAKSAPFDLVLMDMSLPVVDGWEATRQLRGEPDTARLPIIALTAHALVGDERRCLDAGCDAYASKPIDFRRLLAQMECLLGPEGPRADGLV